MVDNFFTLPMAQTIVDGAQSAELERGIAIVVSVFDCHGQLKLFARMGNTSVGSIEVAQLKGQTSAPFPVATAALAERSAAMPGNPYSNIPGMILLGGGMPILSPDGVHLGGVGVSGATPDVDEACAQRGIDGLYRLMGW